MSSAPNEDQSVRDEGPAVDAEEEPIEASYLVAPTLERSTGVALLRLVDPDTGSFTTIRDGSAATELQVQQAGSDVQIGRRTLGSEQTWHEVVDRALATSSRRATDLVVPHGRSFWRQGLDGLYYLHDSATKATNQTIDPAGQELDGAVATADGQNLVLASRSHRLTVFGTSHPPIVLEPDAGVELTVVDGWLITTDCDAGDCSLTVGPVIGDPSWTTELPSWWLRRSNDRLSTTQAMVLAVGPGGQLVAAARTAEGMWRLWLITAEGTAVGATDALGPGRPSFAFDPCSDIVAAAGSTPGAATTRVVLVSGDGSPSTAFDIAGTSAGTGLAFIAPSTC